MTYPVARMRSMTPKILRRYALWAGSDRPTPRGSGVAASVSPMDEVSGVVAKEVIDENEDVLLLWGLEDIGPLGFRSGWLYRYADNDRARKGTWRY